jgi:hypothetical protein
MYLTVFMIPASTLFTLASLWLMGASVIVTLFMLNHRRLRGAHHAG